LLNPSSPGAESEKRPARLEHLAGQCSGKIEMMNRSIDKPGSNLSVRHG
jgi:hypothetical protein